MKLLHMQIFYQNDDNATSCKEILKTLGDISKQKLLYYPDMTIYVHLLWSISYQC